MRWLAALAIWLWAMPAEARWLQAETPHFIVYSDGSEVKLREFSLLLEDYDAVLRDLTGTKAEPSPNKLQVYLLRGSGQLGEIRNAGSGAAGLYLASPGGIAAFAVRNDMGGNFGIEGEDVILHEYAHHFMMQYFPYSYPAWYVEGFAEYMMTAEFTPTRIEIGRVSQNRAYGLVNAPWVPADKLLASHPGELKGEQRAMFYAQAWLAVHYVNRVPGKLAALRAYLSDIGRGKPSAEAFQAAFGTDFDGFQRELRRYMRGRDMTYSTFNRAGTKAQPPITVRALPPSADALLLSLAHLQVGVGKPWRAERLAQVRRDAARFPGDPFALRVLALAEARIGEPQNAIAIAIADKLISHDPRDAQALFAKGAAQLALAAGNESDRAALLGKARQTFVQAHKIDPNHVPTLFAYAQAQMASGGPTKNAMEVLFLANSLAPQVSEIGMMAGYAALHQKRFDDAKALLRPIAFAPHGGGMARAAARMLEAAETRQDAVDASVVEVEDEEKD